MKKIVVLSGIISALAALSAINSKASELLLKPGIYITSTAYCAAIVTQKGNLIYVTSTRNPNWSQSTKCEDEGKSGISEAGKDVDVITDSSFVTKIEGGQVFVRWDECQK